MAAKKKIRIVFTFDEQSLAVLEEIKDDGNYACFAETVRDSLQITRSLQKLAKRGYSEIIVRDPKTEEERLTYVSLPYGHFLKRVGTSQQEAKSWQTIALGSENVFKDLGFPSPDERLVKAKLAYKINRLGCRSRDDAKGSCKFFGNESIQNDSPEKWSIKGIYH